MKSNILSEQNCNNRKNFLTELQIMRQYNHPNIIKYHRYYDCEDFVAIIMDFIPGGNLIEIIEEIRIDEITLKKFTFKMLKTLHYLHKNHIIHRDLKLDNILVKNKRILKFKLADFGLSSYKVID